MSLYDIGVKTIDGKDTTLAAYKGKALLIVNTASECGYTPQYKGLEALYQAYKAKGLEVLAFPSNDFGGQEPGTNADIKKFCELKYKTTFPLFDKVKVKEPGAHPLYAYLQGLKDNGGAVKWNFNKFLVTRDGQVVAHFDSKVEPESKELTSKLDAALSAKAP
ncbi:MAG: glutathione peroxidase [Myxococcaceae bacterium]|nr:glutathione peroxidase [Myxococcaceae bacterium]